MPKNRSLINLLPQEEFDSSILGRVLHWAMSSFRIIVIVTELVVMAAFLSRFWLDAQNADLTDSIDIKASQISAQAQTEKEFRDVQAKLNIFKQITSSVKPTDSIQSVTSVLPQNTTISSISVSSDAIEIKGVSASEIEIAQFVSNLKANKSFKSVDLGQVSSSVDNSALTVFNITISY